MAYSGISKSDVEEQPREQQQQQKEMKMTVHKMAWTYAHDVRLCQEMLLIEPYQHKYGSRGRGKCWDKIAMALNQLEKPQFFVDQRAIRDHYLKLERAYKRKVALMENASSIRLDQSELDLAVEVIMKRSESAARELERDEERKIKIAEKERLDFQAARKRSIDRLAGTRERKNSESGKKKRRKITSLETVQHLRKNEERDVELRTKELELKEREIRLKEKMHTDEMELRRRDQELKERDQEIRKKDLDERGRKQDIVELLRNQAEQQQKLIHQMQDQQKLLFQLAKKSI